MSTFPPFALKTTMILVKALNHTLPNVRTSLSTGFKENSGESKHFSRHATCQDRFILPCPLATKGIPHLLHSLQVTANYRSFIGRVEVKLKFVVCYTHSLCRVDITIKWLPHRLVQTKTHDISFVLSAGLTTGIRDIQEEDSCKMSSRYTADHITRRT